jgi:hypothetical protein
MVFEMHLLPINGASFGDIPRNLKNFARIDVIVLRQDAAINAQLHANKLSIIACRLPRDQ